MVEMPVAVSRRTESAEQSELRRHVFRRTTGLAVRHVVLVAMAALTLFPVVLIISTALKTPQDVRSDPFGLFSSFSFENLRWPGLSGDSAAICGTACC